MWRIMDNFLRLNNETLGVSSSVRGAGRKVKAESGQEVVQLETRNTLLSEMRLRRAEESEFSLRVLVLIHKCCVSRGIAFCYANYHVK